MKKDFLALACLAVGTTLVHAQSYMAINGVIADVSTNYYQGGEPTGGETPVGTSLYDYALFVSPTPITDGATDPGWTQVGLFGSTSGLLAGVSGLVAGAVIYDGGNQFQSNIPVGTYYVEIVGWSSGLGSSWSQVEGELENSYFGEANNYYLGVAYSSTPDFQTAAAAPGDNIIGPTGITDGSLVLYPVYVPEPTSLALAGLGGLSMLFLRRHKS